MQLQRMKLVEDKAIPGEYFIKIYYDTIEDQVFKQQEIDRAEVAAHGNDLKQSNTDSDV